VPHSFAFFANEWVSSQSRGVGITLRPHPCSYSKRVTKGLIRYYGSQDLHFITCSCYRRQPQLKTAKRRDLFLKILEETRRKYRSLSCIGTWSCRNTFICSSPNWRSRSFGRNEGDQTALALRVNWLRKRPAPAQIGLWDSTPDPVWQKRFYDFNVWTERKRIEKLRYMHRNPVKRGLALEPAQWNWSSYRWHESGEVGRKQKPRLEWTAGPTLFAKNAKRVGHPLCLRTLPLRSKRVGHPPREWR